MKSSKHVETCFVRANNDFDDKLTAFWMKNIFWTKIPKNGHCEKLNFMGSIVKCIVRSSTCISQPWLKPHAFLTGLRSEFRSEISDAISFSYGILAGRVEVEIADGAFYFSTFVVGIPFGELYIGMSESRDIRCLPFFVFDILIKSNWQNYWLKLPHF